MWIYGVLDCEHDLYMLCSTLLRVDAHKSEILLCTWNANFAFQPCGDASELQV